MTKKLNFMITGICTYGTIETIVAGKQYHYFMTKADAIHIYDKWLRATNQRMRNNVFIKMMKGKFPCKAI